MLPHPARNNIVRADNKVELLDAQHFAYFAAEAIVWEEFMNLMSAKGAVKPTEIEECINSLKTAVTVEEKARVSVEIGDINDGNI